MGVREIRRQAKVSKALEEKVVGALDLGGKGLTLLREPG